MILKRILMVVFVLEVAFVCYGQDQQESTETSYKVIAYFSGSRGMAIDQIQAHKITHINYAFANIANGRVLSGQPLDSANFQQLNKLKERNPHLKTLISVGGWSWSNHFSDAALTEESREIFASSALEFLIKYRLDGIDLDWEYPGQKGEDNVFRKEDKANFTLLLKVLREKLDAQSKKDHKSDADSYLLTIATAANQNYLDHTNMGEAQRYLDFINIMTYDFHGGWSDVTGHHTGLYHTSANPNRLENTQIAVEQHIAAGIPKEKLVIGAAFYGRGWEGVTSNDGLFLYREYEGKSFAMKHDTIQDLIAKGAYQRHWDQQARAPYLWNATTKTIITYDDAESLSHKCEFVKKRGLGGVMFWEYTQDQSGVLLETLFSNLLK